MKQKLFRSSLKRAKAKTTMMDRLKTLHEYGYTILGIAVLALSIEAWIVSSVISHEKEDHFGLDGMRGWCEAAEKANPGFVCPAPENYH